MQHHRTGQLYPWVQDHKCEKNISYPIHLGRVGIEILDRTGDIFLFMYIIDGKNTGFFFRKLGTDSCDSFVS